MTATLPEAVLLAAKSALPGAEYAWPGCVVVMTPDLSCVEELTPLNCAKFQGDGFYRVVFRKLRSEWLPAYWRLPGDKTIYDSGVNFSNEPSPVFPPASMQKGDAR